MADLFEPFCAEKIRGLLTDRFYSPVVFDTLRSTNDTARELARQGAPEGTVVIAASQTGGRGRMGRSFFSPDGTGLYMSILLRPKLPAEDSLLITTAAAVAAAEALEEISGRSMGIKWVNDIYCGGKKVCGILTEGGYGTDGSLAYAILGIGVNLFAPEGGFPSELAQIADAVFPAKAEKKGTVKNRAAAMILEKFLPLYRQLPERMYLAEYRARSVLTDQSVNVLRGDSARPAKVLGIDDHFGLLVRYEDDGTEAALSTGEVSVRLAGTINK